MVKMILALPQKIDCEKLANLIMEVIKGRYGEGYYGGVELYFASVLNPYKDTKVFVAGFSGKANLRYYETNADELDPVMIATLEEFLSMFDDAGYSFVADNKILPHDWWKPPYKMQSWNGRPYYSDGDARTLADEYFEKLESIDAKGTKKDATTDAPRSKKLAESVAQKETKSQWAV